MNRKYRRKSCCTLCYRNYSWLIYLPFLKCTEIVKDALVLLSRFILGIWHSHQLKNEINYQFYQAYYKI